MSLQVVGNNTFLNRYAKVRGEYSTFKYLNLLFFCPESYKSGIGHLILSDV